MKKIKIVYANTVDYSFALQQRPHHIFKTLSTMGYDVHWINSTQEKGVRPDRYENLTVWHDWEVFLKRNPECDIYFSSWANRHIDLDRIKAKFVVYDSLDNFPENEPMEKSMIDKSDLVFVTSEPLFQLRSKEHNNVHYCRNGCWSGLDEKISSDWPSGVTGDYVLFSGALGNWVDIELINKLAELMQVVIVGAYFGPIDLAVKNAVMLGTKNYIELQSYYRNALVNIVPFKRCQTADFSNPIKMYESSVYGTPTVSTDIPEAILHQDIIHVASNHNDFINLVQKACKLKREQENVTKLKSFAAENDWSHRVYLIDKEIRKLLSEEKL